MAQHLDTIALREVRTNAKGGKSAQATLQGGKPIVVIATLPPVLPLRGKNISETRLNIDFGYLEGMEAIFRGLDEQLIKAAINATHSLWPGKTLTAEQVRKNYTGPLKERPEYCTNLRCKIDTEKVRC